MIIQGLMSQKHYDAMHMGSNNFGAGRRNPCCVLAVSLWKVEVRIIRVRAVDFAAEND